MKRQIRDRDSYILFFLMCKSPFCVTQNNTELNQFSVGPIYLKEW